MACCDLCAQACGVNRLVGELGTCKTGVRARVSSYGAHMGEEDPLRGWNGSGTIFFARCNMHCQFCQNYKISQVYAGQETEPHALAAIMMYLQAAGCHNINLVSPSHVVAQILEALVLATRAGLRLPLVYNTGGYDSVETLKLLEGVVDIYMPDMKYADNATAFKYSRIRRYAFINHTAVREMHRQVGDLRLDENGIAMRGLLVRHLVLPHRLAGTHRIIKFVMQELSPDTYLNLMDQYRPSYRAHQYPELSRPLTSLEYEAAIRMAIVAGVQRLDRREDVWSR